MSGYFSLERLKQVVGFMMLVLCLLTLAITLTIHARWLYVYDLNHSDVLDYVDLSPATILKNYDQLLDYFNYPWIKYLKMSDFPTSNSGAFHMFQVKILFQVNYVVFIMSAIYSFFYIWYLKKTSQLWTLVTPLNYLLILLGIALFFVAVGFNEVFILFHKVLFFGNDDWIFNPLKDPVILALPQEYFFHCFILFFSLFIIFILLFVFIGKVEFKRLSKKYNG